MTTKFMEYTIVAGDSLQMIAQKTLGDASRGMELATLNELDYPFITDDTSQASDTVKTMGDIIYIPMEISNSDVVDNITDDLTNFGYDLSLSTDKTNLSFSAGGDFSTDVYGDLAVVGGLDTLVQDLSHRIMTKKGTLPFHPTYGSTLLEIIGNKKVSGWKQKAVIELSRTIRSDPRVRDITNVSVIDVPLGVELVATIVTSTTQFQFKKSVNL